MILNDETGLPEVPEGHYWEVVEVNSPLPGTLRVELRVEKEITKTKTVFDELPKKWYQFRPDVKERTVEYTVPGSEYVDWEPLVDVHVYDLAVKSTKPVGLGWEQEPKPLQTMHWGYGRSVYVSSTTPVTPETHRKYYRRHPSTPESILAAAEKIVKRLEHSQQKEATLLREAEERAKLVGKYPPKTLKG